MAPPSTSMSRSENNSFRAATAAKWPQPMGIFSTISPWISSARSYLVRIPTSTIRAYWSTVKSSRVNSTPTAMATVLLSASATLSQYVSRSVHDRFHPPRGSKATIALAYGGDLDEDEEETLGAEIRR